MVERDTATAITRAGLALDAQASLRTAAAAAPDDAALGVAPGTTGPPPPDVGAGGQLARVEATPAGITVSRVVGHLLVGPTSAQLGTRDTSSTTTAGQRCAWRGRPHEHRVEAPAGFTT